MWQHCMGNFSLFRWSSFFAFALLLLACQRTSMALLSTAAPSTIPVPVTVTQSALRSPSACTDHFVAHTLPFATGVRIRTINTYESNGAGVAVNDLDGDGDLDLVFASIDNNSEILWNKGNLKFIEEPLADRFTRAVSIVDVDADGALDIVFTHRTRESLSYWRNQGANSTAQHFTRTPLPGVIAYANSMAWADLNGDGALDLVTGSYNIDLIEKDGDDPAADANAGVFYYERQGAAFVPQRLTGEAQALSVALVDVDGDGQLDIWVANDFLLPDALWLRKAQGWQLATPFAQTTYSTMSMDWGDLANDGNRELFATDMSPYDISPRTLAGWLPVMNKLEERHDPNDPQRMDNVLQVRTANGAWQNQASRRGVEATGWSWASRFGDLDNDGFLDLYVVNGMIAQNLFAHLPNGELVEENQAFRNQGDGTFAPAPTWQLGATASGRGMVMADLDNDGDLDIVVNNLRASAQLFENQLCGGDGLEVALQMPNTRNRNAIGAQLVLQTNRGRYQRDVRASGGYLSGDPARVHFGFPTRTMLQTLEIHWPDGAISQVEPLLTQTLVVVTRN